VIRAAVLLMLAALAAGCLSSGELPPLASAQAAPDIESYQLRRVGLLPFAGEELTPQHAHEVQSAFLLELGRVAPFEIIRLTPADMIEVVSSEPYRRGSYHPRTLLELARRYRVDGLVIGTVTQVDVYPPQVLGLELDLVSCETGMILWSSRLHLDASDPLFRRHLESYQRSQVLGGDPEDGVQLTLVSPTHFARFAARELARQL
jgi:hypothetical protein